MQRELKFRVWDGHTMFSVNVLAIAPVTWMCAEGRGVSLVWQPHVKVMQYTGLKDKTGKEIYEGDIVEGGYLNPLTNRFLSKKYVIEYNEGGFCGRLIGHSPYGDTRLEFIEGEIIGNIYSNPEFLKEGE